MNHKRAQLAPSNGADPRSQRSRNALHKALLELIAARPIDQISVRELTAHAGVGYATFHRHYASKDSLVDDAAADQIRQMLASALGMPFDTFLREYEAGGWSRDGGRAFLAAGSAAPKKLLSDLDPKPGCLALCSYVEEHDAVWSALLASGGQQAMKDEFIKVASYVASTLVYRSVPVEIGILIIAGSTFEILTWWLRQRERLPAEQIATMLNDVVMTPVVRWGLPT